MKLSLHRINRLLASLTVFGLAATGGFVGCRGQYGATPIGGGGSTTDFLTTGRTASFFQAIQVDPRSEDSAGPQFVTAADIDSDGLLDLVSAWNQSQPVQIHFQRRNAAGAIGFETITLAGNIPVVRVAGLTVSDLDQDGAPDVVVLIKETGEEGSTCLDTSVSAGAYDGLIIVYFGPVDPADTVHALAWNETPIESSRLAGLRIGPAGPPEEEGFTSMALADVEGDGDTDIVIAWNDPCNPDDPKVLIFTNGGFGPVRDGTWPVFVVPDPFPKGPKVSDEPGLFPIRIKDVALGDVDNDGDSDIIATYPDAVSMNVRWYRNPAIDIPDDYHCSPNSEWKVGVVSQIAPKVEPFPGPFTDLGGADVIRVGDVDGDGLLDVVVRSSGGKIIQWLKGPGFQAITPDPANPNCPLRNIPWRMYTLAEYNQRTPEGLTLGDVNMDGQLEVIASANGGLAFFDSQAAPSVYDQWTERLIVDDQPPGSPGSSPATTDPNVAPSEVADTTFINSILVVDLDGDGANDIVATFDRSGLSGLSNDALVWFRNTLTGP